MKQALRDAIIGTTIWIIIFAFGAIGAQHWANKVMPDYQGRDAVEVVQR